MPHSRGHVVLLGDSIFDNAAYVGRAPDVVRQLRTALGDSWSATLLAVDGAVIGGVERQLHSLPADASLLVVSAGGNDALGEAHLLQRPATTVGEALMSLADAQKRFARNYEAMVDAVVRTGIPVALCTIYDANFPEPEGTVITSALSLFNDAITRAAFRRGLPLIDLRLIFEEVGDYANAIEPSEQGGAKMAAAIARLATGDHGRQSPSMVVAGQAKP